jgi:hypothetical protein
VSLIAESTMMQSPPNMQYLDYFDISNKVHLYISTEDDDGYAKAQPILGDGASVTRIGIRHFFKNSFIAGNAGGGVMPYTLTYPTKFELFRGKVEDGRCGYYDTAIRYRAWATGAARQAMVQAGGPWVDNPDVSDRVKDSDFYYIAGGQKDSTDPLFWTTLLTDMARIQGFIGTLGVTPMLGLLYAWAQNMDFVNPNAFLPPKFTPLIAAGNQDTALQSAAGANIHLSYYTLPCFWDSSVTGAGAGVFRLDDFIGTIDYNNIAAYCIRDKLNNPIGIPGFQPDPPVGPPE